MDQDKPPKMFLRIYQQSEENIDRFLARIILPEGVNIEKGGLRGTINIAVPEETEDARNWEVLRSKQAESPRFQPWDECRREELK